MTTAIAKHAKHSIIIGALFLGACGSVDPLGRDDDGGAVIDSRRSGDVVDARSSSSRLCIECGTVRDITPIEREGNTTGIGAVVGAVVGGVAGRQVGGGTGRDIATVAGAVAGGVAGNEVEQRVSDDETVYNVRVRMEDGTERVVTVADAGTLRIGDPVTIDGNDITIR